MREVKMREVKMRRLMQPDDRKKAILHGAMELFTHKGYEETSMRDIARYLNISLGLCYRYYDSKQKLFNAAMDVYIETCCAYFIKLALDVNISFDKKMDTLFLSLEDETDTMLYHDFFHKPENTLLHEQLGLKICDYMCPYLEKALQMECEKKHMRIKNSHMLIRFLTYGQISILSDPDMPSKEGVEAIRTYINYLLKSEMLPDES